MADETAFYGSSSGSQDKGWFKNQQSVSRQHPNDLINFLGHQAYLLDGPIALVEVFAGAHARLSSNVQKLGGTSIKIGLHYGHDLSLTQNRNLLMQLIGHVQPLHVWVAWQCTSVAGYSALN